MFLEKNEDLNIFDMNIVDYIVDYTLINIFLSFVVSVIMELLRHAVFIFQIRSISDCDDGNNIQF